MTSRLRVPPLFHRRGLAVPHFEKMLYDQALLALAYTEAYQPTGRSATRHRGGERLPTSCGTSASPEGGFASAEDADSEGQEGRFYLWSVDEVRSSLAPGEAELAVRIFSLQPETGLGAAAGADAGKSVLRFQPVFSALAEERGISEGEISRGVAAVRARLLAIRERRPGPLKTPRS